MLLHTGGPRPHTSPGPALPPHACRREKRAGLAAAPSPEGPRATDPGTGWPIAQLLSLCQASEIPTGLDERSLQKPVRATLASPTAGHPTPLRRGTETRAGECFTAEEALLSCEASHALAATRQLYKLSAGPGQMARLRRRKHTRGPCDDAFSHPFYLPWLKCRPAEIRRSPSACTTYPGSVPALTATSLLWRSATTGLPLHACGFLPDISCIP